MTQASISGGRRMSTAKCYLDPARKRANLTIETDAMVESLVFEGHRCTGVRYPAAAQNARPVLHAKSSSRPAGSHHGTAGAPGIGQGARLKGLGIEVRHELPGVGENLRDHWAPRMKWRVGRHGVTFNERARGMGAVARATLHDGAKRVLSHPASPMRAFFRTREGLDSPDAMFTMQPSCRRRT